MPDYGKSVRLNAEMRDAFKRTVRNDILPNRPNQDHWIEQWNDKAFDEIFDKDILALFAQLPDWMMEETNTYVAYMGEGGKRVTAVQFDFGVQKRLPRQDGYISSYSNVCSVKAPIVPVESEMVKSFNKFRQDRDDWDKKSHALSTQLSELIDPLNTTAQLYKAWPGAWKYKSCFPWVPKNIARTSVTATEMEVGIQLSKMTTNSEVEEN